MTLTCEARVLTTTFQISGTEELCHNSTVCGKSAYRKVVVDDGDASLPICESCKLRLQTKNQPNSTWYGWFDCAYPPTSRIRGSMWYHETMKASLFANLKQSISESQSQQNTPESTEHEDIQILSNAVSDMTLEDMEEPVSQPQDTVLEEVDPYLQNTIPEKEWLLQTIKQTEEWLRSSQGTQASVKDKAEKYRMIMRMKYKLYMLK